MVSECFRTITGRLIDVANIRAEDIDVSDIAHGLSMLTVRFHGQSKRGITCAQHSVMVAALVPKADQLAALFHDASDTYLNDIAKPIKKILPDFIALENKIMQQIAIKFGFEYPKSLAVEKADQQVIHYEWNNFVLEGNKKPWKSKKAKRIFLQAYGMVLSNQEITLEAFPF